MSFYLERVDVKHGGRRPLPNGSVSIGRNPGNTVVIPADDRGVSGYHAVIYADPQRILLQDLHSTNGTFVNGRQVQECVLCAGDEVGLGRYGPKFRVTIDDAVNTGNASGPAPMPTIHTNADAGIYLEKFVDEDIDTLVDTGNAGAAGACRPSDRPAATAPIIALTILIALISAILIYALPKTSTRKHPPAGKEFFSAPVADENADGGAVSNDGAPLSTIGERINDVLTRFGEDGYRAPPEMVERVEHYINLYQGAMRRTIALRMERGQRYFPMIRELFSERNVPLELAYVSMLESGFNTEAVSHAGAVGLWQFMPHTARRYGLRVGDGVDERTDPEKATRAAAAYFKDLIAIFGSRSSVLLCMAAYNAGEQRVINALKRIDDPVRDRDFWHLYRMGWLARETNEYIPQVIALIIISDNPEEYGFLRKAGGL